MITQPATKDQAKLFYSLCRDLKLNVGEKRYLLGDKSFQELSEEEASRVTAQLIDRLPVPDSDPFEFSKPLARTYRVPVMCELTAYSSDHARALIDKGIGGAAKIGRISLQIGEPEAQ